MRIFYFINYQSLTKQNSLGSHLTELILLIDLQFYKNKMTFIQTSFVNSLEHLKQTKLGANRGTMFDAQVEYLRKLSLQLLYSGPQMEEWHLKTLILPALKAHHITHIVLKLIDGSHILFVYFLRQNVHVLIVRTTNRNCFGQDLKVTHRLHQLKHVITPFHEHVQVVEAVVVALGPRTILTHHFELVYGTGLIIWFDPIVRWVQLYPPQLFLVEIDPFRCEKN